MSPFTPRDTVSSPPAGVELNALPPGPRLAKYDANLRRTARRHPGHACLHTRSLHSCHARQIHFRHLARQHFPLAGRLRRARRHACAMGAATANQNRARRFCHHRRLHASDVGVSAPRTWDGFRGHARGRHPAVDLCHGLGVAIAEDHPRHARSPCRLRRARAGTLRAEDRLAWRRAGPRSDAAGHADVGGIPRSCVDCRLLACAMAMECITLTLNVVPIAGRSWNWHSAPGCMISHTPFRITTLSAILSPPCHPNSKSAITSPGTRKPAMSAAPSSRSTPGISTIRATRTTPARMTRSTRSGATSPTTLRPKRARR